MARIRRALRQYDDGGLIDVNHVPVEVLTSVLELTPEEATPFVTKCGSADREVS